MRRLYKLKHVLDSISYFQRTPGLNKPIRESTQNRRLYYNSAYPEYRKNSLLEITRRECRKTEEIVVYT